MAVFTAFLVLCDATEALAQSVLSGSDGPIMLAEAGRRRRVRRPPPTESEQPAQTEEGGEEGGGEEGGEVAAPEEGQEAGEVGEATESTEGAEGGDESFATKASTGGSLRRSDRMDFDERLVKGQGARSGAVYLFKRTPRKLPELVALRTSYRGRIVDPVLGRRAEELTKAAPVEPEAAPSGQEGAALDKVAPEPAAPDKAATKAQRRRRRLRPTGSRRRSTLKQAP